MKLSTKCVLGGLVVALLATVPWWGSAVLVQFGINALILAALAQSWNIIGGYTGYPSFGNSVFYGLGGYGVAIAMVQYGLTFPVGKESCSLILGGWGGTTVGLSNIDEQDASGNETTQYIRFEDRRWYAVRVRVTESRITAWLDDRQIIDVATAGKSIGIRPEVDLSRPLGIAAYRTRAAIRGIEIRTLE